MPTDAELLRLFASDGSQEAFGEVVNRNIALVYRSALRQLGGDGHAAEDIAQAVFILLARKAGSIPTDSIVAAWLFTATRYAVSHHVREQHRRTEREKEAQIMNEINATPAPDSHWARFKPDLDDLIATLRRNERDAILLRFLQGRSLAEVGRQLGISPDAARMRIDRGLEKLKLSLAKRGVGSTAAAVGAMLTAESALATPPLLASSVTSAVLSGLSVASSAGFYFSSIAMAKIKTSLAAVFISGALVTAVIQEHTKAQLRAEITALAQKPTSAEAKSLASTATDGAVRAATGRETDDQPPRPAPRPRRPSRSVNSDIPGGLAGRGWLSVSALRDSGRADVPAAVETMLWGQAHPETTALATTLWITTVKNVATGKEQWVPVVMSPDSAEAMTAAQISKREPFSEVQVIEQVGAGDNAYVTLQFRTVDGKVAQQTRRLHVTGDGWKWRPSMEQLTAGRKVP